VFIVLITSLELFHAVPEQGLPSSGTAWKSYTSYLPVHKHSEGMMSQALQEAMLSGAKALCYNIFVHHKSYVDRNGTELKHPR